MEQNGLWQETPGVQLWNIAYGNGMYVGVAGETGFFSSPDLLNWTERTDAVVPVGVRPNLSKVIFCNGQFVALGIRRGRPTVLTSSDGISWSAHRIIGDNPDIGFFPNRLI
jgi:hypothetical protein